MINRPLPQAVLTSRKDAESQRIAKSTGPLYWPLMFLYFLLSKRTGKPGRGTYGMRNHTRALVVIIVALLAFVVASALRSGDAQRRIGTDTYAITNARIVPGSGPVTDRGTVVFRDGVIVAVGANITAPADARVIDGTGLTVYPGIIDANTTLAIPRPSPTPGGGGGGGFAGLFGQSAPSATSPNSPNLPGMQPEILASDLIRP